MAQITLSPETIEEIKSYFDSYNDFEDFDHFETTEDWKQIEGAEFMQDGNTIYVDGNVHAHYDECINSRYGGYVDDCSEWVNDQYEIDDVAAYDEDGEEVQITNSNELLKAA